MTKTFLKKQMKTKTNKKYREVIVLSVLSVSFVGKHGLQQHIPNVGTLHHGQSMREFEACKLRTALDSPVLVQC